MSTGNIGAFFRLKGVGMKPHGMLKLHQYTLILRKKRSDKDYFNDSPRSKEFESILLLLFLL